MLRNVNDPSLLPGIGPRPTPPGSRGLDSRASTIPPVPLPGLEQENDIAQTMAWLHPDDPADDPVFELCIINPKQTSCRLWEGRALGSKPLVAGWYQDKNKAAAMAAHLHSVHAKGIYLTLNPCQEALLARANERLKANVNRTTNQDIADLRNLLLDVDPKRLAGISSTDQEHEAALEMIELIRADLAGEGWSEPLIADSGNGGHLTYPLDLPNTDETVALLKAVLAALALRYADHLARLGLDLDQAVFNPSRLTKLYGTWARKGDSTPDRPHRQSKILPPPSPPTCAPGAPASAGGDPPPAGRHTWQGERQHYGRSSGRSRLPGPLRH